MSTKRAPRKESKFIRYMKGPVKILARARDFYVRSMTTCAGHAAVGVPNLHFQSLPRSFSANSSCSDYSARDDDLRELIRVASTRKKAELLRSSPMAAGGAPAVPRSRTVTIGRIDEDKPYEFGGDGGGVVPEVYPRSKSYAPSRTSMLKIERFKKMKEEEKQRKFHEALLKMLYPPPSDSGKEDEEEEEEEDEQAETNLTKLLNDPPEEDIENEEPSSSDDNKGGDGKLTRAQRKRLRKRKLKEADSRRRKIIGPLLADSNDPSHGSVDDASDAAEGVRRNAVTNVSGDLSHGNVEVVSDAPKGVRQNAATNVWEEEASCSKKNKMKLKQRRKSKKMAVVKSTASSTTNQNEGLKVTVDDRVEGDA